jgi:hypothetical protein
VKYLSPKITEEQVKLLADRVKGQGNQVVCVEGPPWSTAMAC